MIATAARKVSRQRRLIAVNLYFKRLLVPSKERRNSLGAIPQEILSVKRFINAPKMISRIFLIINFFRHNVYKMADTEHVSAGNLIFIGVFNKFMKIFKQVFVILY